MSDELYHLPLLGLPLTEIGISTTTDNHGNSLKGNTLTCHGNNQPITLTDREKFKIHNEIGPSDLRDFVLDGVTEIVDGLSPLQKHCNLHAVKSRSRQP